MASDLVQAILEWDQKNLKKNDSEIKLPFFKAMHNEIPPEMRNRQQFPCDTCGKVFLSRMGVNNHIRLVFNTSYLTDSYIGFTLKMESVSKNTISGLK